LPDLQKQLHLQGATLYLIIRAEIRVIVVAAGTVLAMVEAVLVRILYHVRALNSVIAISGLHFIIIQIANAKMMRHRLVREVWYQVDERRSLLFFSLLVHNASLLGKKNERHGRRV
jgi:branched-subunit amino acid ABC-type transport system permease component